MNLPACPACQLVPQAMMLIFFSRAEFLLADLHLVEKNVPVACETRPNVVSRTARGCS